MGVVRLGMLCLCATLAPAWSTEVSERDFTLKDIAQPGGLGLYVRWESASRTLTYKEVGIPDLPIDSRKLTAADSRKVDEGVAFGLDRIAALIAALPDQKSLPDDGTNVFDGGRYELSCGQAGQAMTRTYDNLDAHDRLMDAACVGLVAKVLALVKRTFAPRP